MTPLSDEQLEDVLQGRADQPEDLDSTSAAKLTEMKAIQARLQHAFASVQAPDRLRTTIEQQVTDATGPRNQDKPRTVFTQRFRRLWPAVAAAAMLLVGIPLLSVAFSGDSTAVAQTELAEIHESNLKPHDHNPSQERFPGGQPCEMAGWMSERVGKTVAVPTPGDGMELQASCMASFRNEKVASYLVLFDGNSISIVVLKEQPRDLGLIAARMFAGHRMNAGTSDKCNFLAVRFEGWTYVAVGEASHEVLAKPLVRLLTATTRPDRK
ncbi:MAG: hypothetical protein ACLFVU_02860 [Phycisphaerae bacterium]